MKTQLLLIVFMMTGFYGFCQKTHIPDAEFRRVLSDPVEGDYYGLTIENDSILNAEAENITNLDNLYDEGISDLTGIEAFVNLTGLDCSENTLTSLGLSKNTKLTSLNCSYNNLTTLNLSHLTALTSLSVRNNNLTFLNIQSTDNTLLTSLDVVGNSSICVQVNDEDYRPDTGWLFDSGTIFSEDCEALINNTITILDANFEQALIDLGHDTNDTINGSISLIDAQRITRLIVSDPGNESSLPNVDAKITDLTGIEAMTALTYLDCSQNELMTLNVSKNTALTELYCSENKLTTLDVSKLTSLEILITGDNNLTSLNIKNQNNMSLTTLDIIGNPSTCVQVDDENYRHTGWVFDLDPLIAPTFSEDCDILINTKVAIPDANFEQALIDLGHDRDNTVNDSISLIDAQRITRLDIFNPVNNSNLPNVDAKITDLTGIEAMTSLTSLDCSQNELITLDLSNNTALTYLSVSGNKLTALDVKELTLLTSLLARDNGLTFLNIKNGNNTLLTTLDIVGNPSICVQVDDEDYRPNTGWISNTDIRTRPRFSENCEALINTKIAIPDENFEQVLIDLGHDTDNTVNQSISLIDAQRITRLDIFDPDNNNSLPNVDAKITDLTGIEAMTSLTYLDCSQNELTTLDLNSNTALTGLRVIDNQLTDLDISGLTLLTSLSARDNDLTFLNIKNGNNTLLTSLDVVGNPSICVQVDDEDYRHTGWAFNQGAVFSENCNTLINTIITIPDANFEQALIDLGHDRDNTVNQSISLINAQSIVRLDVFNPVNNTSLPNVDAKITNLTGIEAMTSLTSLDCSDNELTTLNLSSNTALTRLRANNNKLTDLDISGLTLLTSLSVRNNQLTSLNIQSTDNTLITSLDVIGNPSICVEVNDEDYRPDTGWAFSVGTVFSEDCNTLINTKVAIPDANFEQALIDLGHDTDNTVNQSISLINAQSITRLDIFNPDNNSNLPNVDAKITDLTGIGAMTSLTYLDCSQNELTTLDLNSNTALTGLRVINNQLTDLDISGLTLLTSLSVRNNQLTSLNIQSTDNTLLTSLDVVGNSSICVQVNDEDYRPDTGWLFDSGTIFSEDCEEALSIDKNQLKESISIYPNPVSDILRIQILNQIQLKKIQIYNVIGELLKEEKIYNTVQISDLSTGIFFVKIETDIGIFNTKIVKL